MRWFEGLLEEIEIKARYKELAKANHPDLGGCVETMKIINAQYEKVLSGHYQRAGKSITEVDELLSKDAILRSKMNELLILEGLIIELCGCWLWATGETKIHKEKLKACKFMWSSSKKAWYWRAESKKCYGVRKPKDLDTIRYQYGSESVKGYKTKLVTA